MNNNQQLQQHEFLNNVRRILSNNMNNNQQLQQHGILKQLINLNRLMASALVLKGRKKCKKNIF